MMAQQCVLVGIIRNDAELIDGIFGRTQLVGNNFRAQSSPIRLVGRFSGGIVETGIGQDVLLRWRG